MVKVYILGKVKRVPDNIEDVFMKIWIAEKHNVNYGQLSYDFALWYYYQGRKHKGGL